MGLLAAVLLCASVVLAAAGRSARAAESSRPAATATPKTHYCAVTDKQFIQVAGLNDPGGATPSATTTCTATRRPPTCWTRRRTPSSRSRTRSRATRRSHSRAGTSLDVPRVRPRGARAGSARERGRAHVPLLPARRRGRLGARRRAARAPKARLRRERPPVRLTAWSSWRGSRRISAATS